MNFFKPFCFLVLALSISTTAYSQTNDRMRKWYETYLEVVDFKMTNQLDPFMTSSDPTEKRLGEWLNDQLIAQARGLLSEGQQSLLKKIFGTRSDYVDLSWMKAYNLYKEFRQKNNKVPVLYSSNELEATLGLWVNEQLLKYKDGSLCAEKIFLMESVEGHDWEAFSRSTDESYWDYMYRNYKQFLELNSRAPFAKADDDLERKLAKWLDKQQLSYKNGVISPRRYKLLSQLAAHVWIEKNPVPRKTEEEMDREDAENVGGITGERIPEPSDEDIAMEEASLGIEENVIEKAPSEEAYYEIPSETEMQMVERVLREKTKGLDIEGSDMKAWWAFYVDESMETSAEEIAKKAMQKIANDFAGDQRSLSTRTIGFLAKAGAAEYLGIASGDKVVMQIMMMIDDALRETVYTRSDIGFFISKYSRYEVLKGRLMMYARPAIK